MRKPLIGITCNLDYRDDIGVVTHLGCKGEEWQSLSDGYISSVEKAGGIPIMIPICDRVETVKEMAERLDGFLISGGNDIDPRRYGARAKAYCGQVVVKRDNQDISFVKYLLEKTQKPILGICRGIQVLNVASGGTLYQDLEKEGDFEHHFMDMYPKDAIAHEIRLEEASKIYHVYRKERIGVNSFHHQAVKSVGEGLMIAAVSDDGVIEAIEKPGDRFVVGIQWHPEMMADSKEQEQIFRAFVSACQATL